jgi:hypothetical protein
VITLVRNRPGVRAVTRRSKISCTCPGLSLADEDNALGLFELLPLFGGDVVFALPFAELNHRNLLPARIVLQRRHELLADRVHQRAGDELVAAMKAKEVHHPLFPLQTGNIDVQVHPINAFDFQGDVLVQHFGNASWCAHFGSRRHRPFGTTHRSAVQ